MGTGAFAADPIEEKVKVCTACHGEKGIPQLKTTPVIWGQNAGYLFYQLRDFKSGSRKNDLMSPIAASLQQADLLPLAEYFSKLQLPNLQQSQATADGPPPQRRQTLPSVVPVAISTTFGATALPLALRVSNTITSSKR